MARRHFLSAAAALGVGGLSACATKPRGVLESTEVPESALHAAQHWIYRRTDGFNGLPRGILTRQVLSADAQGIRIQTTNENGAILDNALFASPGTQLEGTMSEDGPVTGRMQPGWRRYDFPLVSGKRWSQNFYLHRTDLGGTRNYVYVDTRVEGWEDVNAGGKTYRALVLRRFFDLDKKNHWQGTLYRNDLEWYAPALGAPVRLHTREEFYYTPQPRMSELTSGDWFIYELQSA
jgi:hypothetical protein